MLTSLFRSPKVDCIPLCAYALPFTPHLLSLHRLLACTCMDRLFVSPAHFHALVLGSDLQCSLFFFSFSFSFLLLPWVSPLSSPPLVLRLSMRLDSISVCAQCDSVLYVLCHVFVVLLLLPFCFPSSSPFPFSFYPFCLLALFLGFSLATRRKVYL